MQRRRRDAVAVSGAGGEQLLALPDQPSGTPWPDPSGGSLDDWPTGEAPNGVALDALLDEVCDPDGPLRQTLAVVVVHRGRVVGERYGGELFHFDRPPERVGPTTALISWSMAKSMLHAVVGMLVTEGAFAPGDPAPVEGWGAPGDPRRAVTLDHLLSMRDGLAWTEDYVEAAASDVIEMLFGTGQDDVAAYAADRPLAAEPGTRFNYSSGASNLVSGVVARVLGPGAPYRRFLADRLFGPLGMASAAPGFDEAGTWVASSYVHATARDFARFGLLYLRGGVFAGRRLVAADWVDTARRPRSVDPVDGQVHSAHWWVPPDPFGTWAAQGYEGQSITCCPALDLLVVRLGKTPAERAPLLRQWRAKVVDAFAV